jgi:cellulose 1,4-beta-cellobiosidase
MAARSRILAAALAAGLAVSTLSGCGYPPRAENPFDGATGYVNPQWAAEVNQAAAANPSLAAKMRKVASQPTAVWLDRIAAINPPEGMGLRAHLDAAVKQQEANGGGPLTFLVVIYDLPNRDCSALASNGELKVSQNGLARYKAEYIDPIAEILSDGAYANIRVAAVIEPDSLPNLVTNVGKGLPACDEAQSSGAYVQGVQYALDKLHAIGNVYSYIDIAHSGWLGWDSNLQPAVDVIARTVQGTQAGYASVDGFISNTANYTTTTEPYLPKADTQFQGQQIQSAKFLDWNKHFAEDTFDQKMYERFVAAGFPSTIGMLVDTSRNGWGGAGRPTGPSTSTDLNTFVDQSRIDRRLHKGNWCNQSGAGIGELPRPNPMPNFDAFVWIKPPGESDGSSAAITNDQGKGFDRMCDPTYGGNSLNGNNRTGALPDAPIAGQWFGSQFTQLVQNAYPAL